MSIGARIGKRGFLAGLLAGLIAASQFLGATPAVAAPGDPFDPNLPIAWVGAFAPTDLYTSTNGATGTVDFTVVNDTGTVSYNAMGFNPRDGYLYAVDLSNRQVLRIGQGGLIVNYNYLNGPLPLRGAINYNTGAVDPTTGTYYASGPNSATMQVINLATKTYTTVTLSRKIKGIADFTWYNGYLWGADRDGVITRISPTGTVTTYTALTIPADANAYGAAWTLANGSLVFVGNSGTVYQVNLTTNTYTNIGTSPEQ